ncbi:hypothetical protein CPAR01_02099 [Colletotrichum paranaense]|uniref:Alpha/beta hydrolase fold-3 domain-containing protein n=1 Tax=Colletotrichum paranaense TaxID=1914294 RepID=A0ABQ9SZW8_9PEZI|nr:uncharacterized protein CPAR01_02099 [Colletotrichum paranaense]KAK1544597.1 hypothetical protein CPAR01_02099 [Colletotrichum paranaense]
MSDQVGFSFQADVVNTASLGHVLTGRLLKALSDGGVDTYAMWAAVQLGKRVPVQTSHQSSLYAHIMSKKTYQSVLSKALSIGWGHSAPVADLARTVAGTNAIILIGALGTGCQAFAAAQCLSEVMAIYGLEADMRPSVDVLKGLVNYLAPFTQDLGFSKVLQHITILAERVIRHENRRIGVDNSERIGDLLMRLKDLGGAAALARAIKQLIHTAQKDQRDYMTLKTRGSWLPAFASHILGMSVEVRLNQTVVWASGGDHGHILFQLDDEATVQPTLPLISQVDGVVARVKQDYEEGSLGSHLKLDYPIGEALEAQFLKRPEIDDGVAESIRVGINNLSHWLLRKLKHSHPDDSVNLINGLVDGVRALEDALHKMGIHVDSNQQVAPKWPKCFAEYSTAFDSMKEEMSLYFLDLKAAQTLANSCPVDHRKNDSNYHMLQELEDRSSDSCPCRVVGRLMHGFATTALALMFCNFDTAEVRVQDAVIAGEVETDLSRHLILDHATLLENMEEMEDIGFSRGFDRRFDRGFDRRFRVSHKDVLCFLGELICCDYTSHWFDGAAIEGPKGEAKEILVVSGRDFTINYKCVMENECFDECGRTLRIQSGRASVAGAFRNIVVEDTVIDPHNVLGHNETTDFVSLAGRTTLEPCHRPPETGITIDASIQENAIAVRLNLAGKAPRPVTASLAYCVYTLMTYWAVPKCNHEKDGPYTLEHDQDVVVSGFHVAFLPQRDAAEVLVYALTGNTLEQLLICGLMPRALDRFVTGRETLYCPMCDNEYSKATYGGRGMTDPGEAYAFLKFGSPYTRIPSSLLPSDVALPTPDLARRPAFSTQPLPGSTSMGAGASQIHLAHQISPKVLIMESFIKSRETRPELLQTLLAALPPRDKSLEEFRDVATLPDGYKIDLQIVRPRGVDESNADRPLILLWPGGGFIVAGVEPTTRPAREFALEFGAVVVNATYRLAPEHKFPRSVKDGWETAVWLSKNASRFGGDISKGFIVGGWSAGANIASVVSQRSGVEGLGISGTLLGIPFLLVKEIVPEKYAKEWVSRETNAEWSPTFTTAVINDVSKALQAEIKSPWYSPFNDPEAIPKSPKAYIQVGDRDPLRDDGLIYAKVLKDNGVESRVDNYPDWGHQGWTIFAPQDQPAELGPNTMKGMRWLLGKE